MAQHDQKNVEKVHLEVGNYVSRFIRTVNNLSSVGVIQKATEHTPEKITANRTFAQITFEDALDAFENIIADVRRHVPQAQNSEASIAIYQQLMNARSGAAKGVSREEARASLDEAVQKKLASPIIQSPGAPQFYAVLEDRVDDSITLEFVETWDTLVGKISQLYLNEETLVAENTAQALQAALQFQFNKSSDPEDEARMIDIGDGELDGYPEAVAGGRGGNSRANDNLPAVADTLPQALQALLIQAAGGVDITDISRRKAAKPVFGRGAETQHIVEILLKKDAPHALLHGEEGVGLGSTVRALAQRIADKNVPAKLEDARIVSFSIMNLLLDGGGARGMQPPDALKIILEKVAEHNSKSPSGRIILHIEDIGTDAQQSNLLVKQLVPMMRSVMAHTLKHHGENLSIILDTPEQHLDVMKKTDPLILKTFTSVGVKALPQPDVMACLNAVAPKMADEHGVTLPAGTLEFLVKKTDKFMPNEYQPAKSMNVLRNVLATAEANGRKQVTEDDIVTVIAKNANLPKAFVSSEIADRIDGLENKLLSRVFGQDHAVRRVADTIGLVNEGLHDPKKPLGVFFLPGPTGVGKTELAKALAKALFDDDEAVIRVDMGQFHDKHTTSRLVGSPPGYIGYGDKGVLDEVEKRPFSVVLFDEIEKAHSDVDNALLPVFDDGMLVKMDGKKLNFRNTVIICTSNLGAKAVESAADRNSFGFGVESEQEQEKEVELIEVREEAIKARMKPEFRGRMTTIHMNYLLPEIVEKITLKKIGEVSERLRDNKRYQNVEIKLAPAALKQLMDVGYEKRKGARHMDQAIQEQVREPLLLWLRENKDNITGRSALLTIESIKGKDVKGEFRIKTEFAPPPVVQTRPSAAAPAP